MATYIVKPGDTLGKLARRFYGNAALFTRIVQANAITNPDLLKVGQVLVIPDEHAAPPAPPVATAPSPPPPTLPATNRLDALNERRIAPLHPALADRARRLLQRCEADGLVLLVTQSLRTYEEQDGLYAQGRTKRPIGPQHIVTYARGGYSWHNFGLAFDVAVLDSSGKMNWNYKHPGWALVGEVGKSLDMAWGGDWKKLKDFPHFEYTGDLSLLQCRQLYELGLDAIWSQIA